LRFVVNSRVQSIEKRPARAFAESDVIYQSVIEY
jgi:hypothetical protein